MHNHPEVPPHLAVVPKLLTTDEAAEYCQLSHAWFERHRWTNTGPRYVKIGRAVRYRVEDLLAYIEGESSG